MQTLSVTQDGPCVCGICLRNQAQTFNQTSVLDILSPQPDGQQSTLAEAGPSKRAITREPVPADFVPSASQPTYITQVLPLAVDPRPDMYAQIFTYDAPTNYDSLNGVVIGGPKGRRQNAEVLSGEKDRAIEKHDGQGATALASTQAISRNSVSTTDNAFSGPPTSTSTTNPHRPCTYNSCRPQHKTNISVPSGPRSRPHRKKPGKYGRQATLSAHGGDGEGGRAHLDQKPSPDSFDHDEPNGTTDATALDAHEPSPRPGRNHGKKRDRHAIPAPIQSDSARRRLHDKLRDPQQTVSALHASSAHDKRAQAPVAVHSHTWPAVQSSADPTTQEQKSPSSGIRQRKTQQRLIPQETPPKPAQPAPKQSCWSRIRHPKQRGCARLLSYFSPSWCVRSQTTPCVTSSAIASVSSSAEPLFVAPKPPNKSCTLRKLWPWKNRSRNQTSVQQEPASTHSHLELLDPIFQPANPTYPNLVWDVSQPLQSAIIKLDDLGSVTSACPYLQETIINNQLVNKFLELRIVVSPRGKCACSQWASVFWGDYVQYVLDSHQGNVIKVGNILQLAHDFLHRTILGSSEYGKIVKGIGNKNREHIQTAALRRIDKSGVPFATASQDGLKRVDALFTNVWFDGLELVPDIEDSSVCWVYLYLSSDSPQQSASCASEMGCL